MMAHVANLAVVFEGNLSGVEHSDPRVIAADVRCRDACPGREVVPDSSSGLARSFVSQEIRATSWHYTSLAASTRRNNLAFCSC
jgi:hypothetical protein